MLAATLLSFERLSSSWSVRSWASLIEWNAVGSSMYVVSSCMMGSCRFAGKSNSHSKVVPTVHLCGSNGPTVLQSVERVGKAARAREQS